MPRYILSRRVFNTLSGRGYKLICKICGFAFKIARCPKCGKYDIVWDDAEKINFRCNDCEFVDDACNMDGCVESKPSKYRLWRCEKCGEKYSRKQEMCVECGGRIYTSGRKFYHCKCYDDSFFEVEDDDDD